MCSFQKQGKCNKGNKCTFAHTSDDLVNKNMGLRQRLRGAPGLLCKRKRETQPPPHKTNDDELDMKFINPPDGTPQDSSSSSSSSSSSLSSKRPARRASNGVEKNFVADFIPSDDDDEGGFLSCF